MVLVGLIIFLMCVVNVYGIDILVKTGRAVQVGKTEVKQSLTTANSTAIAVICVVYNIVCGYVVFLLV